MNLQKKFDEARENVESLRAKQEELTLTRDEVTILLAETENELRHADTRLRECKAMLSVAPPRGNTREQDELREEIRNIKRDVFRTLRKMPDVWITPSGLALLAEVEEEHVASILRKAAGLDGVPVEHNGRCGPASKYRWTGVHWRS